MLTKKEPFKNENNPNKNSKSTPASSQGVFSLAKAPTQQPVSTSQTAQQPASTLSAAQRKMHHNTRITIKYDIGYSNQLTIRGKGANLNWERGQPLKNVQADEWIWETDAPFSQCEFKVLINDREYEKGENHLVNQGASFTYTPQF